MSLSIVHITDFHFENSTIGSSLLLDSIEAVIRNYRGNTIVLSVSGDIAASGKQGEYEVALDFFADLSERLQSVSNKVHLLFVPGNHDVESPISYNVLNAMNNSALEKEYDRHLRKLDNFFAFASLFEQDYRRPTDYRPVEITDESDGTRFKFYLLNTACYSAVSGCPEDHGTDKGRLYIPEKAIAEIQGDSSAYSIVVAHHEPDWLIDSLALELKKKIDGHVEICLFGHMHRGDLEENSHDRSRSTFYSKGAELSQDAWKSSGFRVLTISGSKRTMQADTYCWDRDSVSFIKSDTQTNELPIKTGILRPTDEYLSDLNRSPFKDVPLSRYYTFPGLTSGYNTRDSKAVSIDSFSSLFSELSSHRCINISGDQSSGKTALLRMLYVESVERGYIPIMVSRDNSSALKKQIDSVFAEEYGTSPLTKAQYDQEDFSRKMLIIDDFDQLSSTSSRKHLLKNYLGRYQIIIIASFQPMQNDLHEYLDEYESPETFTCYSLSSFTKTHRDELIHNLGSVNNLSENEVQHIIRQVDHAAQMNGSLFCLNPSFTIQYLMLLLDSSKTERDHTEPFSKIYRTNLMNKIEQNCSRSSYLQSNPVSTVKPSKDEIVKETDIALREIAYHMFRSRKTILSSNEITMVIRDYNARYATSILTKWVLDLAEESGILSSDAESIDYYFSSNDELAFYIASSINSNLQQRGIGNPCEDADVQSLLQHIGLGINEKILIFLTAIHESPTLPQTVCSLAVDMVGDSCNAIFDCSVNPIVAAINTPPQLNAATPEDRNRQKETTDEIEKRKALNDKEAICYRGIFEYDDTELNRPAYKAFCCVKYLELAGKSLTNNYLTIPKVIKDHIAECLLYLPPKIIYLASYDIITHYDEIIPLLDENLCELNPLSAGKHRASELVYVLFTCFALTILENIAFTVSDAHSADFVLQHTRTINDGCPQNIQDGSSSVKIVSDLFRSIVLLCTGNPDNFLKEIKAITKHATKEKLVHELFCIRLIVNRFILLNPHLSSSVVDSLLSIAFPGETARENAKKQRLAILGKTREVSRSVLKEGKQVTD